MARLLGRAQSAGVRHRGDQLTVRGNGAAAAARAVRPQR